VTVDVLDAKGIKVYRSVVKTDAYGTATIDMPLSNEPNLGTWKINVITAETNRSSISESRSTCCEV